jgi:hypothetical protein
VDTQGDAFFVAFVRASDAVAAAGDVQEALERGPVRVRIGIHTGARARSGPRAVLGGARPGDGYGGLYARKASARTSESTLPASPRAAR